MQFRRLGLLAVVVLGSLTRAKADTIVYQNTSTVVGGLIFNGASTVGSDLAANIDIDELTLAGSAGESITSLSILADNANGISVEARPTIYIWAANGAGGVPGTLLGDFALPLQTMATGSHALDFTLPGSGLLVPANMMVWVGIGFDNDNGASSITTAELNDLGAISYHPATVGIDGPDAYFLPPGSTLNDPAAILFNTTSTANYGWTVNAVAPTATPEPSSAFLFATALLALLVRRRRISARQPVWPAGCEEA